MAHLKMLEVSISHITKRDNDLLEVGPNCPLRLMSDEYGYVISLCYEGAWDEKLIELNQCSFSEDFMCLIKFAVERGYMFLLIDRDGEVIENLPVHVW